MFICQNLHNKLLCSIPKIYFDSLLLVAKSEISTQIKNMQDFATSSNESKYIFGIEQRSLLFKFWQMNTNSGCVTYVGTKLTGCSATNNLPMILFLLHLKWST